MNRPTIMAFGLACVLLLTPIAADATTSALTSDGSIIEVVAGTYGDLFPDGNETAPGHEVLAVDIAALGGERQRLLVPATESATAETAPTLVYERASGTSYLLWQGTISLVHSVLHLTTFDGEVWGPVIEIASNPYTEKSDAQLLVTRDEYESIDAPGERVERTAIHVTWSEATTNGTLKHWTPILIEDGQHLSWMPTWNLTNLLPVSTDNLIGENTALRLQSAWNDHSIMLGFFSTYGDRVGVVEIELLPGELGGLADKARWQIISGLQYDSRDSLATAVRQFVIDEAVGFHPANRAFIAKTAHASVLNSVEPLDPAGLGIIADKARWQVINGGARFGFGGLEDEDLFEILEVARPDGPNSYHLLAARVRTVLPTPEGIGDEPQLFFSKRGTEVIVAWEGDGAIHYFESADEGWSEARAVPLTDDLDAASIYRMLEDRVRGR